MFSRKNILRTIGAMALAGGMAVSTLATAGAASASTAGNPTPPPAPKPVLREWTFDLQETYIDGLSLNDVRGRGAVTFNRWRNDDSITNPNLSRFFGPSGSLNLWHDNLLRARFSINPYTCSVDIAQPRGQFRILSGTGIGSGWRVVGNSGQFNLVAQFSYDLISKHRDGVVQVCPLALASPRTIIRSIALGNGQVLGRDAATVDFSVQGRALLAHAPVVTPHPFVTPSVTATASA